MMDVKRAIAVLDEMEARFVKCGARKDVEREAIQVAKAALKAQGEAEVWEIERKPIAVPDCDEASQIRLKIGNQSFNINDYCENHEQAEFMAQMLDHALRKIAAPQPVQPAMRPKRLEWRVVPPNEFVASTPWGDARVELYNGHNWCWSLGDYGGTSPNWRGPDEAKAAAQATFDSFVSECFEPGEQPQLERLEETGSCKDNPAEHVVIPDALRRIPEPTISSMAASIKEAGRFPDSGVESYLNRKLLPAMAKRDMYVTNKKPGEQPAQAPDGWQPIDPGELWSFLRKVMCHGADIFGHSVDHEHYHAVLDSAASNHADKLYAMLAAAPAAGGDQS